MNMRSAAEEFALANWSRYHIELISSLPYIFWETAPTKPTNQRAAHSAWAAASAPLSFQSKSQWPFIYCIGVTTTGDEDRWLEGHSRPLWLLFIAIRWDDLGVEQQVLKTADSIGSLYSQIYGNTEGRLSNENKTADQGGLKRHLPGITWKLFSPVTLQHHRQTHLVCTTDSCGLGVGVLGRERRKLLGNHKEVKRKVSRVWRTTLISTVWSFRSKCVCRWNFEAVAAERVGSEIGFGKRWASSGCTGCVVLKDRRRHSLFGGFVRFQELLGECVDLVGASDLVGQQRQFDYVKVLVEILHLQWRQEPVVTEPKVRHVTCNNTITFYKCIAT